PPPRPAPEGRSPASPPPPSPGDNARERPAAPPTFPCPPEKEPTMDDRFEDRAADIADQERKIQAGIDAKEGDDGGSDEEGAVQAGARKYPEPPFPKQHQRKPGEEFRLDPAPMYDAPFWKGSGKLEGMA